MRTNIVLNEVLVREAMRYATARTKRALVEECMEAFIKAKSREERLLSYRARVRKVQATTAAIPAGEASAAIIRRDRDSR